MGTVSRVVSRPTSEKGFVQVDVPEVIPLDVEPRRQPGALQVDFVRVVEGEDQVERPARQSHVAHGQVMQPHVGIEEIRRIDRAGPAGRNQGAERQGEEFAHDRNIAECTICHPERSEGSLQDGLGAGPQEIPRSFHSLGMTSQGYAPPLSRCFAHHSIRSRIRFSKPSSPGW